MTTVDRWPPPALAWALLILAATVPGLLAAGGPFFYMDDYPLVEENPFAHGRLPLSAAFTAPYFNDYAPLHHLLIVAQWHVFGAAPLGFRIVSMLLHLGAGAACWWMLTALTGRSTLALGVTLLWAVHPAQAESVAWIVEQKNLWSGLLTFLAVAAYADGSRPRPRRVALALPLMVIGLLGKAHTLVVAPIVVLSEWLLGRTTEGPLAKRLLWTLPFVALAMASSILALVVIGNLGDRVTWTPRDTLLHLPGALGIYARVTLLPWTASFFHDLARVTRFGDPAFLGKLGALAAAVVAGWLCVRPPSRRLFLFALLASAAALGPMLNVSVWVFPAHDRYLYTALPFLLLALALVAESTLGRLPVPLWLRTALALWALVLAAAASLGIRRGALFAAERAVMEDAVRKAPDNAYAHAQLAHTVIQEWRRAGREGRAGEQQRLAAEAAAAVTRARQCWNFTELYHTPVHVLVAVADVLRRSRQLDDAEKFLAVAATEPRWTGAFAPEQALARRFLAEIERERAEQALTSASPATAETLAREALAHVETAGRWMRPGDTALAAEAWAGTSRELEDELAWVAHLAHLQLRDVAAGRGQDEAARAHLAEARAALGRIRTDSRLYQRARRQLASLEASASTPR